MARPSDYFRAAHKTSYWRVGLRADRRDMTRILVVDKPVEDYNAVVRHPAKVDEKKESTDGRDRNIL